MNNNFREKYLKYKTKYLQLKSMIGGGEKTAKQFFNGRLNKNYNNMRNVLINDRFIQRSISNLDSRLPINKPTEELSSIPIFEEIFQIINNDVSSDIIDLLCKIYLSGQLGSPNSIENKGRLIDNVILFNKLKQADRDGQLLNNFVSLRQLEDFITSKQQIFAQIEEKKRRDKMIAEEQIRIRKEGEEYVEKILDTDNIIVYHPTTEAGAKFYGRNTKWCTTSGMFNSYNRKGPLYILELKKKFDENGNRIKYQMHLETNELMDSTDEEADINDIITSIDDIIFNDWLSELIKNYIENCQSERDDPSKFASIIIPMLPSLKKLCFNPSFLNLVNDYTSTYAIVLPTMHNLDYLIYDDERPLGNMLSHLTNLQTLIFTKWYNQQLGNSLSNLTNLHTLIFYPNSWFNQSFGDSLSNLTSLQTLKIGNNFNKSLGDSLYNLNNLQSLIFYPNSEFNQPFGNSLSNLTNLQTLEIGKKFSQPLGDSLTNLTNLKLLRIPQKYEDSVKTLRAENKINQSAIVEFY